ncbi:MAG: GUN4 domain-containing protein [Symploca sp. SIO3C6]|uniref:GUN4 domain-containing protein n=1 Tax=Symploca sp. SIO1C4 TaxID=2607765 RepID=A0A6B3N647_9CYAN|nr:GUN4 domain-containing protein [Symploca sp. SIO3C6]NER27060.1 GUN4 domain-containing protein [Symploca sp. SIO1C4]NET07221.1 GUN4 domain-containing protein [Symploca sp. SIO2B6]
MTNLKEEGDSQLSTQLSEIKAQLSHLSKRLEGIETNLTQVSLLSEQVSRLEDNFMLVADIYRYQSLQNYLESGNWFEADKETIKLIQDIAGQTDLEELSPNDIKKFPCNGLRVIDKLWHTHSKGRFGFSVQLQIYQSLGGNLDTTIEQNQEIVEKFGEQVGWRANKKWLKCSDLDYSLKAPVGCHPSRWWNSPYGSKMTNYFLSRLMTCEL